MLVPPASRSAPATLRVQSATTRPVASVVLKAGHVQPVWAGHPWVFAQAVERIEGGAQAGDEVDVKDARGNFLGRGLYSPGSAIPVRLLTRDRDRHIDAKLLGARLEAAIARRRRLGLPCKETNAVRLVHAEGDELPGLVVDQLGDVLSVQFGTVGMKRREETILDALEQALRPRAIVDRSSERAAKSEGFAAGQGVVRGDTSLSHFDVTESGLSFHIPLELGQKTGFYVDQRDLRARVAELSRGQRVLDTYAFVGAFALGAARAGASEVEAVDQSALALTVAADAARLNGLEGKVRFECEDSVQALDRAGKHGGFDVVICDPPKLAPTRAARARALGMMRKLSAQAARATKPGGLLVLCSCSAAIGLHELTRVLSLGAADVGLRAIVAERFFQGADHPVPAAFPEGLYLTSIIAEIGKG
jgi:23S rRNA (cytosine1962-C5)-methyltransferase